jgi:hypothetical protein
LNKDEIHTIKSVLSCIGESDISFHVNSHVLPLQLVFLIDDRKKHFDLNWDIMVDERDIVTKMMVSVRDVTSLKNLQENVDQQNSEMATVSEILTSGIE